MTSAAAIDPSRDTYPDPPNDAPDVMTTLHFLAGESEHYQVPIGVYKQLRDGVNGTLGPGITFITDDGVEVTVNPSALAAVSRVAPTVEWALATDLNPAVGEWVSLTDDLVLFGTKTTMCPLPDHPHMIHGQGAQERPPSWMRELRRRLRAKGYRATIGLY